MRNELIGEGRTAWERVVRVDPGKMGLKGKDKRIRNNVVSK